MKTTLIYASVAALLLGACSKTEAPKPAATPAPAVAPAPAAPAPAPSGAMSDEDKTMIELAVGCFPAVPPMMTTVWFRSTVILRFALEAERARQQPFLSEDVRSACLSESAQHRLP